MCPEGRGACQSLLTLSRLCRMFPPILVANCTLKRKPAALAYLCMVCGKQRGCSPHPILDMACKTHYRAPGSGTSSARARTLGAQHVFGGCNSEACLPTGNLCAERCPEPKVRLPRVSTPGLISQSPPKLPSRTLQWHHLHNPKLASIRFLLGDEPHCIKAAAVAAAQRSAIET